MCAKSPKKKQLQKVESQRHFFKPYITLVNVMSGDNT